MLSICILFGVARSTTVLSYTVKDGTDANSYLGNIAQDAQVNPPPPGALHLFKLVKGSEFLKDWIQKHKLFYVHNL